MPAQEAQRAPPEIPLPEPVLPRTQAPIHSPLPILQVPQTSRNLPQGVGMVQIVHNSLELWIVDDVVPRAKKNPFRLERVLHFMRFSVIFRLV